MSRKDSALFCFIAQHQKWIGFFLYRLKSSSLIPRRKNLSCVDFDSTFVEFGVQYGQCSVSPWPRNELIIYFANHDNVFFTLFLSSTQSRTEIVCIKDKYYTLGLGFPVMPAWPWNRGSHCYSHEYYSSTNYCCCSIRCWWPFMLQSQLL